MQEQKYDATPEAIKSYPLASDISHIPLPYHLPARQLRLLSHPPLSASDTREEEGR